MDICATINRLWFPSQQLSYQGHHRITTGLSLCEPHPCPCGSIVDARGLHGLSCKRSAGRSIRLQQLNDVTWRTLRRADIPAIKEPSGLIPGSDLRADGLTLIPWQGGRCLAWDTTVVDTLAMLYLSTSSTDVGRAAKAAAVKKTTKYSALSSSQIFIPVAVETLCPINEAGDSFRSANSYLPSLMIPGRHSSSSKESSSSFSGLMK